MNHEHPTGPDQEQTDHATQVGAPHRGHQGHGWMMIICCLPMLVIAVALVGAGVVSAGFLLVAVACTAMMALMMWGMSDKGQSGDHR